MVSGKYSALSGAISREQAMANISANLANSTSSGFKKDRISFAAVFHGAQQQEAARGINYAKIRKIPPDLSQGPLQITDRPLDVAIEGEGFFKVMGNDGIFYTRSGRFLLDKNGMIKTQDGFNVLDGGNNPMQIAASEGRDLVIASNGMISLDGADTGVQIQLFAVNNQDDLVKVGRSLYRLDGWQGDHLEGDSLLVQGSLEGSNVNMIEEMTAMIAAQRSFEAHTKAIESFSKLSERQDELGTVA